MRPYARGSALWISCAWDKYDMLYIIARYSNILAFSRNFIFFGLPSSSFSDIAHILSLIHILRVHSSIDLHRSSPLFHRLVTVYYFPIAIFSFFFVAVVARNYAIIRRFSSVRLPSYSVVENFPKPGVYKVSRPPSGTWNAIFADERRRRRRRHDNSRERELSSPPAHTKNME